MPLMCWNMHRVYKELWIYGRNYYIPWRNGEILR